MIVISVERWFVSFKEGGVKRDFYWRNLKASSLHIALNCRERKKWSRVVTWPYYKAVLYNMHVGTNNYVINMYHHSEINLIHAALSWKYAQLSVMTEFQCIVRDNVHWCICAICRAGEILNRNSTFKHWKLYKSWKAPLQLPIVPPYTEVQLLYAVTSTNQHQLYGPYIQNACIHILMLNI